jgi:hypothetical protein
MEQKCRKGLCNENELDANNQFLNKLIYHIFSQTIPPKEEKYFSVSGKNSALELPPKMKTQHPAKSASTSSTLMPGYSTPKRRPPSPALSVASSVSVVPETPPSRLASPIRPTENVLSAAASGARPQMGTSNNIGGSKRTILPTAQVCKIILIYTKLVDS